MKQFFLIVLLTLLLVGCSNQLPVAPYRPTKPVQNGGPPQSPSSNPQPSVSTYTFDVNGSGTATVRTECWRSGNFFNFAFSDEPVPQSGNGFGSPAPDIGSTAWVIVSDESGPVTVDIRQDGSIVKTALGSGPVTCAVVIK